MRVSRLAAALIAVSAAAISPANLSAQSWTTWTSATPGVFNGTLFGNPVTFTGAYVGGNLSASGIDYFSPSGAYTQSGLVAPNAGGNVGFIMFDAPTSGTFTFSAPVTNVFVALISVGQGGVPVTYTFDQSFTVASNNNTNCAYWGCGSYTTGVNSISGSEFSGTLAFNGSVTSLSFTTAPGENWHGITIGAESLAVTATPEPASMVLMGSGLLGIAGVAVRRRKAARA